MNIQQRIDALVQLGSILSDNNSPELQSVCRNAETVNPWFTQKNIQVALHSISNYFLTNSALQYLVEKYSITDNIAPKTIGLVLAGNIPLVGFHDLLMTYLVGHNTIIKLSEKDTPLMQFCISKLIDINPIIAQKISIVDKLKDYDAVIATGSNNTAAHFSQYFKHVKHIIRQNRNSIAIIHGDETQDELRLLGSDISTYFGLGCRNVSKVYIPQSYDLNKLFTLLPNHKNDLLAHNKYMNNFEYNKALYLLNKEDFFHDDVLIIKESKDIPSRISTLHYEFYEDFETLYNILSTQLGQIQCIVSNKLISNIDTMGLGQTQIPSIDTFADGVDTVQFLLLLD